MGTEFGSLVRALVTRHGWVAEMVTGLWLPPEARQLGLPILVLATAHERSRSVLIGTR